MVFSLAILFLRLIPFAERAITLKRVLLRLSCVRDVGPVPESILLALDVSNYASTVESHPLTSTNGGYARSMGNPRFLKLKILRILFPSLLLNSRNSPLYGFALSCLRNIARLSPTLLILSVMCLIGILCTRMIGPLGFMVPMLRVVPTAPSLSSEGVGVG